MARANERLLCLDSSRNLTLAGDHGSHEGVQSPATAQHLSLKQNVVWTFAGNTVNAASQWAIIAILAKLGDAAVLGTYAWCAAIALPVVNLAMLQLRVIFVTDAEGRMTFAELLGLRLAAMVLALLVVTVIGILGASTYDTLFVLLLVTLSRALDGVSDAFRALFQRLELMQFSSIAMMLRGVGALVAVSLALACTKSLVWAMIALCAAWLVAIVGYELPTAQWIRRRAPRADRHQVRMWPALSWHSLRDVMPAAIPMGLVMGMIALQSSIPRLFIEYYHDKTAVGFFTALVAMPMIGTVVIGALGQAATPRLSRLYVHSRSDYVTLLRRLMFLGATMGLCGTILAWVIGAPVLRLAYAPEYAVYQMQLVILCVGATFFFLASFAGYAISAARLFGIQAFMTFGSCSSMAMFCYWLIPDDPITGAAIAFTAAGAVQFVAGIATVVWVASRRRCETPL